MEGLEVISSGFGTMKEKSAAKPVQPAKRKRKEEVPRRQSARLRKVVVPSNETPAQKKKREVHYFYLFEKNSNLQKAEEEAFRIKQEEEQLEAEEKARAAKRPRHGDLMLHELVEQDLKDIDISTLNITFETIVSQPHPRRVGNCDAFEYDNGKRDEREVENLRKRLGSMKVVARAKVTQDRIYSSAYHPDTSKDLIFFGGMF